MTADWLETCEALRAGCERVGVDIVHPFPLDQYNAAVPAAWRLEDFSRPNALGVVFGNTRALWPIFLEAVAQDAALAKEEHPLEHYLVTRLAPLLESAAPRTHRVYWAHHTQPFTVPIQRLAELVGLAWLAPSHLSIHPSYGPWLALRAVAVLDLEGPESLSAAGPSPCLACPRPCMTALAEALAASGPEPDARAVAEHAAAWIAIREACPVGDEARYGADQLGYHYTKQRKHLRLRPVIG
jgi:methylmalonic aciduria homocystinuria type C protein